MADIVFQPYDQAVEFNQNIFRGNDYAYSSRWNGDGFAVSRTKDGIHWIETGGYSPSVYAGLNGVQGDILYSVDRRNDYNLLFSKDLGRNWNSVPFPTQNKDSSYFVIPASNCVFIRYVGTDTLYVSKDNGGTWQNTGLQSIEDVIVTQRGTYVQAKDLRTVYFSEDGLSWKVLPAPPLSGELYYGSIGGEPAFYLPSNRGTVLWLNEVSEWVILALPEPASSSGVGYGFGLCALPQGLMLVSGFGSSNDPDNPRYFYFQDSSKTGAVVLSDDYIGDAPRCSLGNAMLFPTGYLSLNVQVKKLPFWKDFVLTTEIIGN